MTFVKTIELFLDMLGLVEKSKINTQIAGIKKCLSYLNMSFLLGK